MFCHLGFIVKKYCDSLWWISWKFQMYPSYQQNLFSLRYKKKCPQTFIAAILKNALPSIGLLKIPKRHSSYNHVSFINPASAKWVQFSNHMPLHLGCSCSPPRLPSYKTLPFNFYEHTHTTVFKSIVYTGCCSECWKTRKDAECILSQFKVPYSDHYLLFSSSFPLIAQLKQSSK